MSKKVNTGIGIVGLGGISKYYLTAIENNSRTELLAVCDRNSKKLRDWQGKVQFADLHYDDFLQHPEIDVVIVATPNATHYELQKKALLAGKHVVSEKPITTSHEDFKELFNLAKEKNLLYWGVYHRRYNQSFASLLKSIRGEKIIAVTFRYLEDIRQHSIGEKWYLQREISGGGCVMDNGVNCLDILIQLFDELHLVDAHLGVGHDDFGANETNALLTFSSPLCPHISLELDWLYPGEEKAITLYAECGTVFYCDFLEAWPGFKKSLWHEYEAAIKNMLQLLALLQKPSDLNSSRNSELIDRIYKIYSVKKGSDVIQKYRT